RAAAGAVPVAVAVALPTVTGATVARPSARAATVLARLPLDRVRVDDPALGVRRDALVVVEVLGGRVGLRRVLERQVQRLVDHLPAVQVRPVDEGDRGAGRAGATGAADPVHVGLVV